MSFEDDLRAALRHEPAPTDFAAKVLSRTRAGWRRPAVWAIAAGITLAALAPPAVLEYRHRREERGLEAKRELFVALRITRAKLQQSRERVHRATARHIL
ncbi:MAG TPA: hypothetical protein VFC21_12485 [Bryobacteraceae bacterium]|nr:hypothetical protein [Bryobacteraceae bacterium]